MTTAPTSRDVLSRLRNRHRGRERAIRLADLAVSVGLCQRQVERILHKAACAGQRVGTSCANLDGDGGEGATPRGMGVYWIVTEADWQAAIDNIDARFAPLAERRRGLEGCRPETGREPVDAARRDLARVTGDGPTLADRRGQGLMFNPSGQDGDDAPTAVRRVLVKR